MSKMDRKLGERLREARDLAGLSQKQLEARSGLSQKTISKIEIGKQDKSTQVLRLAQACGVRVEWLASGEGPMVGDATTANSPTAGYNVLSTAALELGRIWDEAPASSKEAFQQSIVFDSIMRELLGPREVAPRPKEFISAYRARLIEALKRRLSGV